jgi:hypothetical protein
VGGRVPFICTTGGKERYNSLGGWRGRERNRERLYIQIQSKRKKTNKQNSIEKWQNKSNIFIPFFLFFLSTKHIKYIKEKKISIDHAILPIHFRKYFKSPPGCIFI